MVEPPETLMEIREEILISPKGGKNIRKMSHFIKPVLKMTDKTPELPSALPPLHPVYPACSFNGWGEPDKEWVGWVDELHCRYKGVWKKAGIYDAVLSTRYRVVRDEGLLLGLAEKWCCESNTFVFTWGEASVTLEDVVVLGGFNVFGGSVNSCTTDRQVEEVEKQLAEVYEALQRALLRGGVEETVWWMKKFRGRKSEVEHAAFLCLWLSRFILPCYPANSIVVKYFRIAVCLAKGREIAIAPFVLASLYRDLSLLKSAMVNVDKDVDFGNDLLMVTLWAPLQWVQVWAWERFPELRPKPNVVKVGEPRLARWADVVKPDIGNVRLMLKSAGDSFVWRPYCVAVENLPLPGYYSEKEKWVFVGEKIVKEDKVMAHCLRVAELVGLESIEQYNPHRVAMQFGYDQDLPCIVKRSLVNSDMSQQELEQLAWLSYINPVNSQLFYIPSRSYQPLVTVRYLKWLRDGGLTRHGAASDGTVTGKRNSLRSKRSQQPKLLFDKDEADSPPRSTPRNIMGPENDLPRDFEMNLSGNCVDVSPGVSSKFNGSMKAVSPGFGLTNNVDHTIDASKGILLKRVHTNLDVPPGFVPKKSISTNVDVPPGFTPKSTTAGKRKTPSQNFTLKETLGHGIDVPPGFVPKSVDVPPGFKPPVKFDAWRNKVSVMERFAEWKKQRVESSGEALLQSDNQNGQSLHGETEPTRNHGSGLDVFARVRQIKERFDALNRT